MAGANAILNVAPAVPNVAAMGIPDPDALATWSTLDEVADWSGLKAKASTGLASRSTSSPPNSSPTR